MITLENIEFQEPEDEIVIHFSYEGNGINIDKGQFKMTKEKWINYRLSVTDEEMIQDLLEKELSYLVDYMGD